MSALAPTLQAFFTDRLVRQRQASPHTVAAYRDTMRLLVRLATARRGVEPSKLEIDDLDATVISAFLDHREHDQGNGIRTRNARLAAIRSLFRFAALRHPEHAAVIARVLAIPPKRVERRVVNLLHRPGNRRALGGARSHDVDRSTRPRAARPGRPDGAPRLGSDRAPEGRRPPGFRSACQLSRQRTQAAHHAAHGARRRGAALLAGRTGWSAT